MATSFVWKIARRGLIAVGVVTVASTAASAYAVRQTRKNATKLPPEFILDIDLEGIDLVEQAAPLNPFFQFTGRFRKQLELRQAVEALRLASTDERVKGVIATFGANQRYQGLAQIQELRNAVTDFRERAEGRVMTVAYADAFGEAGIGGTLSYYLASAFDKVYMQPSGLLSMSGLASSTPFLRRFFDSWKVKPHFVAREEYKNIINQFTQDNYTKEHRHATGTLLKGFVTDIIDGIAASRGLNQKQARRAIDDAPFNSDEALAHGLIDDFKYRDEAEGTFGLEKRTRRIPIAKYLRAQAAAKGTNQEDPMTAAFNAMMAPPGESIDGTEQDEAAAAARAKRAERDRPVIALITAVGSIVTGKGAVGELQQMQEIASTPMCKKLIDARLDPSVKAVVIRIDSPGGSAVASDTIYREVMRLKEAGKPVIVSMGNVAASGGYYISAPATKIVAQPSTVTGSIGVVFGKFNIAEALRQYGINPCTIAEGKNADAQFPFSDWTREQERLVNRLVDHIYSGFIRKVAAGRGMSEAEVRKIAKGRVWNGKDALAHGLVDCLGGLQDAIELAKTEAGLPLEEDAVVIRDMARPLPLLVQIVKMLKGGDVSITACIASLLLEAGLLPAAGQLQERLACQVSAVLAREAGINLSALEPGPQLISPGIPIR
ncbi:Protease 4 [Coccomyxa sp. Obi]|nr:Protease 4 [Coccomyxa sp. Obi]